MKRSPIHRNSCFLRGLAAILCLQLALPNYAHALRPHVDRTGLEESLSDDREELEDIPFEPEWMISTSAPQAERIQDAVEADAQSRRQPMAFPKWSLWKLERVSGASDRVGVFAKDPETGRLLGFIIYEWRRDIEEEDLRSVQFEILHLAVLPEGQEKRADHWLINRTLETAQRKFGIYRGVPVDVRADLHPDATEVRNLFESMEFIPSGWIDSSAVQNDAPAFRMHVSMVMQGGLEERFVSQDAATSKRLRTEFQAGRLSPKEFVDQVLQPFHAIPVPPPGLAVDGYGPLGVPVDKAWLPKLRDFSEVEIVRATRSGLVQRKAREAVEEFLSRINGKVVPGRSLAGMSDNVAIEMMLEIMRIATGTMDPYAALKKEYNELALAHLDKMERAIAESPAPVQLAIALGIIGNAIDFAAAEQRAILERDGFPFEAEIAKARELSFMVDQRPEFLVALEADPTGEVLFLVDNAGETVLDLPLIKLLLQQGRRVTVAGKSLPHANDMTAAELRVLFADPRVKRFLGSSLKANQLWIIASGSAMTGLDLRRATPELAAAWRRAPIIYAKGQGMIETLRYSPLLRDVFHAVMVKDASYFHEIGSNGLALPLKRSDVLFLHTPAAGLEENPVPGRRFGRRTFLAGTVAAGLGAWWLTRDSERFLEPDEVPAPWRQLFESNPETQPLPYLGDDYFRFRISDRYLASQYRAFDSTGKELGDMDAGNNQRIVDPRTGETLGFYKKPIQGGLGLGIERFILRDSAGGEMMTVSVYPYTQALPLNGAPMMKGAPLTPMEGVPEEWKDSNRLRTESVRPIYRVFEDETHQVTRVEMIGYEEAYADREGRLLDLDKRPIARLEPVNVVTGPQNVRTFEIPNLALASLNSRSRRYFEDPPSQSLVEDLQKSLERFQPATLNGKIAKLQLAHRGVQLQVLLGRRAVAVDPKKASETGEALVKRSTAEMEDFKDPQVQRLLWDAIANLHPWFAMAREAARDLGWERDPEILQHMLSQIQQWWIQLENSRRNDLRDGEGRMTDLTKDLLEEVLLYNGFQSLEDVADGFKTYLGASRLSREFLYIDRPKGSDPALVPLSFMEARLKGFRDVSDVQILLHQAVALERLGYQVSFLSYIPVVNGMEQEEPVKTLSHEWIIMATHPDDSKEAVLFGTHREFLKRFGEETSPGVTRVTRERLLEVNETLPPGFYLSIEAYSLFPLDASRYLQARDEALQRKKEKEKNSKPAELMGPGLGLIGESEGELHPRFEQDLAASYVKTMAQRFDEIVKEEGIEVVTNGLTGSELEVRKAGYGAALGLIPRKLIKDLEKITFLRDTKLIRSREAHLEKGRIVWETVDIEAEGTYSGRTIESVKGVATPVHELLHHWDVHITDQIRDWRGDVSELFYQISWQKSGQGSWTLRKTTDVDMRDFADRGHGLANQKEDLAVNGERYVMDGAVLRSDVRAAMGEGNYTPAMKYLFAKYLMFLDTDGTSFEYSVGDHSPSITWSEVAAAIRTDAEGLSSKPEAKRLGALLERMREVWQKQRESGKIVQRAAEPPLVALAGLEESEKVEMNVTLHPLHGEPQMAPLAKAVMMEAAPVLARSNLFGEGSELKTALQIIPGLDLYLGRWWVLPKGDDPADLREGGEWIWLSAAIHNALDGIRRRAVEQGREVTERIALRVGRLPDRRWFIELSDTGAGIPSEVLGRLFDRVVSTKPPSTAAHYFGVYGAALFQGLYGDELIESFDGSIEIDTKTENGSPQRLLYNPGNENDRQILAGTRLGRGTTVRWIFGRDPSVTGLEEVIPADELAAAWARHLLGLANQSESVLDVHLEGPTGESWLSFEKPVVVVGGDLEAAIQTIASFAMQTRAALQEVGVDFEDAAAGWTIERLEDSGDQVNYQVFPAEEAGLEEAQRFDTVEAFLEVYPMVRPQMPYVVNPQLARDQMAAWAVPAAARDTDDADVTVDVYVYAGETLEQLEWLKVVERQLNRAADRIGGVSFAIKPYPHDGAIEPIRPTVVIQKEGINLPAAPSEPLPVITIRDLTEVTRLMPGWVYAVALHENLRGQVIGPVVGVTLFEDEAGKLVFGVFV